MLNVACVNWRNYAGRGMDYVTALRNGVQKHLKGVEYRFVCLTDRPQDLPWGMPQVRLPDNVDAWWNKLALFHPASFIAGQRVLFFDLDTVLVGDIGPLAGYQGPFAALTNPVMQDNIGSGVMAWEAGTANDIWQQWDRLGRPSHHPGGDQTWIEVMRPGADRLQEMFPGQLVSFKMDCMDGIPPSARVVYFHGPPRPHECGGWVADHWTPNELEKSA